jgi:tRNA A-37 threonylcarbamoyl transferase component Bud32
MPLRDSLPFGMTSMTITRREEQIVANTVAIPYTHASDPYVFVFRFKYNEEMANCMENCLLRNPKYDTWESKCEVLTRFLDRNFPKLPGIFHTVTGIKLWTNTSNQLEVQTAEDLSHTLSRLSVLDVSSRKHLSSSAIDIQPTSLFSGSPEIYEATYNGRKYLYKAHESAFLNELFRLDVNAYYQHHVNEFPHVLKAVDLVLSQENFIEGMLLEWCEVGSLDDLLRQRRVTKVQKIKWISQIAHSLICLHQSDIVHGCVLSRNVFIDGDNNAKLTGFMLESGYACAFGTSENAGSRSQLKNWDILNFGRLMWQCVHDKPDIVVSPMDVEEEMHDLNQFGKKFISLMQGCLSDTRSEDLLKEIKCLVSCECKTLN